MEESDESNVYECRNDRVVYESLVRPADHITLLQYATWNGIDKDKVFHEAKDFAMIFWYLNGDDQNSLDEQRSGAFFVHQPTQCTAVSNGVHVSFCVARDDAMVKEMFELYKQYTETDAAFADNTADGFVEALLGFADVSPVFDDPTSLLWREIYDMQQVVFPLKGTSSINFDKDII
jgi:hypothetical protein